MTITFDERVREMAMIARALEGHKGTSYRAAIDQAAAQLRDWFDQRGVNLASRDERRAVLTAIVCFDQLTPKGENPQITTHTLLQIISRFCEEE